MLQRICRKALFPSAGALILVAGTSLPHSNACASTRSPAPHNGNASPVTGNAAVSSCSTGRKNCSRALLYLINTDRAAHHLAPLILDARQSGGTGSCVGSRGKALAMAATSGIWHGSATARKASFPNDICLPYRYVGENVGMSSGDEMPALQTLHESMMAEGSRGGHYQNLMSRTFKRTGIWIAYRNGYWFVAEDFVG